MISQNPNEDVNYKWLEKLITQIRLLIKHMKNVKKLKKWKSRAALNCVLFLKYDVIFLRRIVCTS